MAAEGTAEVLDAVDAALERHERADLRERLALARRRFHEGSCRVVVAGEFKKGKSSLVNGLLGARVCATDADIATAIPTYVRYGERLEAHLLLDEAPDAARGGELDRAVVDEVATGRGSTGARAVEVLLPRKFLAGGTVLVDTPGISGGLASTHAGIALRALAVADVLLFVTDAGTELSAAEVEFLRQARELCPVVMCALTKVDLYPEWRRILAADEGHVRAAGIAIDVYPLSAPLRHHGLRTGDRELLAESGFPTLAARLVAERERGSATRAAAALAVAVSSLTQLITQLTAEVHRLEGGAQVEEQRAAWEAARAQAADLRGAGSRWQQVLADRIGDLVGDVDLDLTTRVRALRREAAAKIAEMPPARLTADLGPWLQEAVTELILDHQRAVRTQSEQVADAVAEQFGSAAWDMRRGLELAGGDPGDVASPGPFGWVAASVPGSSRLDLGLVALRGGSAGAFVTHAAATLLGLTFPVVLPAAIVLSAVLGGRSWQTARATQLRMLRAEAERAVVAYLEEVDTVARKASRDAVRRLHRQLRETFAARASELFTTASATVDMLAASLAESEQERRARAAEVAEQLAELRTLQAATSEALASLLSGPR
jgi:hypothetical protein